MDCISFSLIDSGSLSNPNFCFSSTVLVACITSWIFFCIVFGTMPCFSLYACCILLLRAVSVTAFFILSVITSAYNMTLPWAFLAARPIVCIKEVSERKKPSLSASNMATKEANAQFLNVFCEVFRSMDTYHFIRQTNFLGKILEKALSNFFRYDFVSSYLSYRYWIASLSVFGLAKIIVLIFGISVVWNEHISLGTVYLFIYYIDMLSDPVEELRLQLEDIPAICAAENRIRAILNTNASMTYGERNLDGEVKSVCIKNVDFLFDNKAVFSNFSKTFIQGNVYALVGPSGIGKSTLLNLVVRLYDCASGSIEINGIPVSDYKKGEIAKEVCYLHQIVASKITVAEYFHGLLVDSLKFKQFYFDLLKVNTIEWNRRISEMSRGEQQALVLIRALMTDKSLVLLDEIFDSIDNVNVNYALNQLRKQKKTIVVITHEQEVMDKCDQIVKLA